MKNVLKIEYILLTLILILGGFLRINNLSETPPSLNWDEAALGYNAYSILNTKRDEYGVFLPLYTRSFDDYKSAIPIYFIIPSIKVFGLNEFGVRFPSALMGTASILLIYLISKRIFAKKQAALLSAFVFAIEPWSVHFSRVLHEANMAFFFLILGFLLFLYSKENRKLFPISVAAFMVSMYTYHSNKVVAPLFLIVLLFLQRKSVKSYSKKIIFTSVILSLLFLIPFLILTLAGQVFARVEATSILRLWPKTQVLQALLANHSFNDLENIIFHNQYYYFAWELAGRYLSYFSPHNLFIREPQEPVTIVAGNSIFYPFEFVPLVIGMGYLLKNIRKYKLLFVLLLISPLPAIFTWNWFQPARTMSLFATFSILIGFGAVQIIGYFSKYFITFITALKKNPLLSRGGELNADPLRHGFSEASMSSYFRENTASRGGDSVVNYKLIKNGFITLFVVYGLISSLYLYESINVYLPTRDSGNWQPGFKETVPTVMMLSENYDRVIIETPQAQPYIFYLFYGKYPPDKYLNEVDFEYIGTPRKHYDFGNFVFREIYWPEDRNLENTLFVGNDQNLPQKDIISTPGAKVVAEPKDRWGNVIHKLVAIE